jgi:hypothetical protein
MSQIAPPMTADAVDALVRDWPDEAKRLLMLSLIRDGVRTDDATPTPPADWRTMKVVPPVLTEEELAELRALDPDDCVDAEEFFKQLDREDRD